MNLYIYIYIYAFKYILQHNQNAQNYGKRALSLNSYLETLFLTITMCTVFTTDIFTTSSVLVFRRTSLL